MAKAKKKSETAAQKARRLKFEKQRAAYLAKPSTQKRNAKAAKRTASYQKRTGQDEGLKAAQEAGAEIVVLCSSDDDYATLGVEFAQKTKDSTIGVIAGYPQNLLEQLKANGLTNLIHVKSNILEDLKFYQRALGIIE